MNCVKLKPRKACVTTPLGWFERFLKTSGALFRFPQIPSDCGQTEKLVWIGNSWKQMMRHTYDTYTTQSKKPLAKKIRYGITFYQNYQRYRKNFFRTSRSLHSILRTRGIKLFAFIATACSFLFCVLEIVINKHDGGFRSIKANGSSSRKLEYSRWHEVL